ncbi:MAG: GNAT family N-acetyltransferase [Candidatus Dependentiae bacterium]
MKNGCYALFILSLMNGFMYAEALIEGKVSKIPRTMDFYVFYLRDENGVKIGEIQFKIYATRVKKTDEETVTKVANIDLIRVDESNRNAGNGQRLLEVALNRMIASGCTLIEARVDANNKPSLHLFQKNGFNKTKITPHSLGESILLQKNLASQGQHTKAAG